MEAILKTGLTNAIVAALLAVIVAVVARFCRRPALVHSLWLLVLLKLVTPPLVSMPVPGVAIRSTGGAQAKHADALVAVPFEAPPGPVDRPAGGTNEPVRADPIGEARPPIPDRDEATLSELPVSSVESEEPALSGDSVAGPRERVSLAMWLLGAWTAGTTGSLVLTLVRVLRFRRLLTHARPTPTGSQEHVGELARRLGFQYCPTVAFLPGRISPMLWSFSGRSVIYLPSGLWERLTPEQADSLLVHELAHLRRHDHWVRLFELAVTALYWWHPVVWWARSELRRAEEECCDAWVVWAQPEQARAYATALVETVEFLSEAPAALPVGASGIGPAQDLRRRVTMIMQGKTPRKLTWAGIALVAGAAAMLLPLAPTFAQRPPAKDAEPAPVREQRDPDKKGAEPGHEEEIAKARAALDKAMADLKKSEDELQARQAELKKAAAALEKLRADSLPPLPKRPDDDAHKRLEGTWLIIVGPDGKTIAQYKLPPDGKLSVEEFHRFLELPRTEPKLDPKWTPGTGGKVDKTEGADRIKDLELRLDKLTRELEKLRNELRKPDER